MLGDEFLECALDEDSADTIDVPGVEFHRFYCSKYEGARAGGACYKEQVALLVMY